MSENHKRLYDVNTPFCMCPNLRLGSKTSPITEAKVRAFCNDTEHKLEALKTPRHQEIRMICGSPEQTEAINEPPLPQTCTPIFQTEACVREAVDYLVFTVSKSLSRSSLFLKSVSALRPCLYVCVCMCVPIPAF